METRYLIQLGVLIGILVLGVGIRIYTKRKLKDIESDSRIVKKKDKKDKVIYEDDEESQK